MKKTTRRIKPITSNQILVRIVLKGNKTANARQEGQPKTITHFGKVTFLPQAGAQRYWRFHNKSELLKPPPKYLFEAFRNRQADV